MTKLTNQEAYDQVITHLGTMKTRCARGGACVYKRGESKCAIGALLPEDLLDIIKDVAGGVNTIKQYSPSIVDFFSECSTELLIDLQDAHDDERHWTDEGFIIEYLEPIAIKWDLKA